MTSLPWALRNRAIHFSSPEIIGVADHARVAHFPSAPFLGHRRGDTVFVDIQSKIEFLFHWCVCWFSVVNNGTLRNTMSRPFVRLCSPFTGE